MKKRVAESYLWLLIGLCLVFAAVYLVRSLTRDPFLKLVVPPGHFGIEYLDKGEMRQYTTSPYFGHSGGHHLHVHDENGREEFFMIEDLIYLRALNHTLQSEIESWPKHFKKAGMQIPIIDLEILDKRGNYRRLRIWASLWYYFQDSTTKQRVGLHTGRVLRVFQNLEPMSRQVPSLKK